MVRSIFVFFQLHNYDGNNNGELIIVNIYINDIGNIFGTINKKRTAIKYILAINLIGVGIKKIHLYRTNTK